MRRQERGPAYPFFEAIKRALAAKGWTTEDLHRESGVARSTIASWAKQPRPPQAKSVRAVADALGMDLEMALRQAGILASSATKPSADAAELLPATPREETLEELQAQLDALLAKMRPEDRERWLSEMAREDVERLERWRRLLSGDKAIQD